MALPVLSIFSSASAVSGTCLTQTTTSKLIYSPNTCCVLFTFAFHIIFARKNKFPNIFSSQILAPEPFKFSLYFNVARMLVPKFVRVVSFILILLRVRMEAWLDTQSSVKKGWLLSRLRRKCMVARQNFSRCRCACALTALPLGSSI